MNAASQRPDTRQYLTACHKLFKSLLALQGAFTYARMVPFLRLEIRSE